MRRQEEDDDEEETVMDLEALKLRTAHSVRNTISSDPLPVRPFSENILLSDRNQNRRPNPKTF